MENTYNKSQTKIFKSVLLIFFGSLILAISAKIQTPYTPVPTTMRQYIVRSRHPLRVPIAKHLWMLFLGGVIISSIAFAPLLLDSSNVLFLLLAVCVAVPA